LPRITGTPYFARSLFPVPLTVDVSVLVLRGNSVHHHPLDQHNDPYTTATEPQPEGPQWSIAVEQGSSESRQERGDTYEELHRLKSKPCWITGPRNWGWPRSFHSEKSICRREPPPPGGRLAFPWGEDGLRTEGNAAPALEGETTSRNSQ